MKLRQHATWFQTVVCTAISASLVLQGCSAVGDSAASKHADNIVARIQEVPDEKTRAATAALSLNVLCTIARAAAGNADDPMEQRIGDYFSTLDSDTREQLQSVEDTLRAISTEERAELLGALSNLDPGDCSQNVNWVRVRDEVIFALLPPARLRTDFCSGGFSYADATTGERSITVAGVGPLPPMGGDDVGSGPPTIRALASPVILGIEGSGVSALHPNLANTVATAEGMSPFGVNTGIPCTPGSCDAQKGLICGTEIESDSTCFAYPVVQQDAELALRGFNYWDSQSAALRFEPLASGQGSESLSALLSVDVNEPLAAAQACPLPTPANPTYNRARYRASTDADHFYRLTMFNQNGRFLTQADALNEAEPRVIHVCYPTNIVDDAVPPGTNQDCVAPDKTCDDDGASCGASWNTPPRKLDQCLNFPGAQTACAETPNWFPSETLAFRSDSQAIGLGPMVFVSGQQPKVSFQATLDVVETLEETGWDWTGSDELLVLLAGIPSGTPSEVESLVGELDDNILTFRKGNLDSGDRQSVTHEFAPLTDLALDDQVLYLAVLAEDDGFLGGFLAGAAVIIAAAVIIYFTGGAALWTTALGTAGALSIWTAIMAPLKEDDPLGSAMFTATSVAFDERIGSTHAPDFLIVDPQLFGVFPRLGEALPGERDAHKFLIHPFADFSVDDEPLTPQCNPGNCASGDSCLINVCVESGFNDSTADRAFRERRDFEQSGGHYVLDFKWDQQKQ